MAVRRWEDVQPHTRLAVRKRIAELVQASPEKELEHEHIEEALIEQPEWKGLTVEDDEFHELITIVYAEYIRSGAVDE